MRERLAWVLLLGLTIIGAMVVCLPCSGEEEIPLISVELDREIGGYVVMSHKDTAQVPPAHIPPSPDGVSQWNVTQGSGPKVVFPVNSWEWEGGDDTISGHVQALSVVDHTTPFSWKFIHALTSSVDVKTPDRESAERSGWEGYVVDTVTPEDDGEFGFVVSFNLDMPDPAQVEWFTYFAHVDFAIDNWIECWWDQANHRYQIYGIVYFLGVELPFYFDVTESGPTRDFTFVEELAWGDELTIAIDSHSEIRVKSTAGEQTETNQNSVLVRNVFGNPEQPAAAVWEQLEQFYPE